MNAVAIPGISTRNMLNEQDAAAYLGLSVRTLQAWRQRGGGPRFYKLGRAVRYARSNLDAWLDCRQRSNTIA